MRKSFFFPIGSLMILTVLVLSPFIFQVGGSITLVVTERTKKDSSPLILFHKSENVLNDAPKDHSNSKPQRANLPFTGFVQNLGQICDEAITHFYSSGEISIGFCPSRLVFVSTLSEKIDPISFFVTFPGSQLVTPVARHKMSYYINYFYGKLSFTNVPTWEELWYYDLYPGIDLRYYMSELGIKYDFVVHPGADPSQIAVQVSESMVLSVEDQSVSIQSSSHPNQIWFQDTMLRVFQTAGLDIPARFIQKSAFPNTYGFQVDSFDSTQLLIIDPLVLIFSTYLGGSVLDAGEAIVVDTYGNSYIVGTTESSNFPLQNAYQNTFGGGNQDVFVTKLDSTGSNLVFSTYLGGNAQDTGTDIALDSLGYIYITGETRSSDFPTNQAYQSTLGSFYSSDAFIARLDPTGTNLVFSTYLGGNEDDTAWGIAVDSVGNSYITGTTGSTNFPTLNAYQSTHGMVEDAFVTKLNSFGNGLIFSTYLGGNWSDYGYGIALDAANNIYVCGETSSTSFPTFNAYQSVYGGNIDAFVTKLNSSGSGLMFSTYFGGNDTEAANDIVVDNMGNSYVGGYTYSSDFPIQNAYQNTLRGWSDAFLTKFNTSGTNLIFSTYIGGSDSDFGCDIVIDAGKDIYMTGSTVSLDFPTLNAYQTNLALWDAFVTKLNATGTSLVFSTYLGGSGEDDARGIAVDSAGDSFITGRTDSTDFPLQNAYQNTFGGDYDAFVVKLGLSSSTSTAITSPTTTSTPTPTSPTTTSTPTPTSPTTTFPTTTSTSTSSSTSTTFLTIEIFLMALLFLTVVLWRRRIRRSKYGHIT
ncbi:MAG: SBBP repeat-containing protein [Candidatus Hodarchaeota archaeon]